ncbi:MAG: hypothetical protein WA130_00160 [Candidatus Methanoperedens sp.]
MVNGFCPAIPYPVNGRQPEEAVTYLASLHALHGYSTIYITNPEGWGYEGSIFHIEGWEKIRDTLAAKVTDLDFVKIIPNHTLSYGITRKSKLLSKIRDSMSKESDNRAEEDPAEMHIDLMLSLYRDWNISCELKAHLIEPYVRSITFPHMDLSASAGIVDSLVGEKITNSFDGWLFTHLSTFRPSLPLLTKHVHLDNHRLLKISVH